MSCENMLKLQTEQFDRQILTFIEGDNIQTGIETDVIPMLTTTKVRIL